jgi:predicted component of viral defense system (DUF524 family)
MAKDILFSLSTADFELSFSGTVPLANSYSLRDFNGGIEETNNNTPNKLKRITMQGYEGFPLLEVNCITNRYNLSDSDLTIATKFSKDGQDYYLPLFFENIDYQIHLTKSTSNQITLWHDSYNIRSKLFYLEKHNTLSGSINFGNNVGITTFEIREGKKTLITLSFTVFSVKVDFLADRQKMIDELSNVHNTLIYQLFNPTKSLGATEQDRSLGIEWLTNFNNLSQEVLKIVERIERKAHNQIQSSNEVISIHKVKRPNKSLSHLINTRGKKELLNRRNVLLERRKVSVNTLENRYIKSLMRQLAISGRKWIKYVHSSNLESLKRIRDNEEIIKKIELNIRRLHRALKNEFWNAVGDELPTLKNKTSFLFHDLFVKFEKLYKTINRGISVHLDGSRFIHTISIDKLYEIWAYCKLAEIIAGIINGIQSNSVPKIKIDTFQAVLETGRKSKIRVSNDVVIGTQWLFTRDAKRTYFSPLVSQQPDLIFEVKSKNELNILDAKYKISIIEESATGYSPLGITKLISEEFSGEKTIYQPKDEDINTMHRYRDAIRKTVTLDGNEAFEVATRIGVILYPHKPSLLELEKIKVGLKSLEKFNIGAVPLSPGISDEKWLENYSDLDKVIPNDPSIEQIRIFANIVHFIVSTTGLIKKLP